jgi:hypothetical protein
MPAGFAPRFAIEAGFLILLGVGAGLADLRPTVIVALLAGGWLLVSLIELSIWRAQARPVGPVIPSPPAREAEPELEPEAGESTVEPEEIAYPLRADAGSMPSEEVEAYTRVLASPPEGEAPSEPAE